ncbi:hypothetical protein WME90_01830 [Sorangium sp. So ce375]|uniref:hypothetical protein n=1 Tax=Sorangium sp. So ce375 TaxID=3133306 RepID=UPI003F5BEAEE
MSPRSRLVVRERQLVAELLAGLQVDREQLRAISDLQLRCIVAAKLAVDRLGFDVEDEQLADLAHTLMELSPDTRGVRLKYIVGELERLRREAGVLSKEAGHVD